MGAIPKSNLPGLRQLHERVVTALERCHESQDVDFKESAAWDALKWKILHSALGMANMRDGGIIVVGVSERDDTWELTGISEGNLATYDPDLVLGLVNAHASPFIELDAALVKHSDELDYLAFQIREFRDTPIVCKKNGPEGTNIQAGSVYIRPPGVPRTTKVSDGSQMHDLLELAAEKRARRILEVSRRVGLAEPRGDRKKFDEELKGL